MTLPPGITAATKCASSQPLARWAWAAALSWLIGGALFLLLPPSPDQFNHAYLGWRIVEGERLYVDLLDMNWPAIAWGHAVAILVFGKHLWSWHALDWIAFAIASACLADLLRMGYGRREAVVLVILAPWAYLARGYWMAGQHDMSAAQVLVLALWCHARGDFKPRSPWTIASGVALGVAILNKPTMAAALALLALQALWLGRTWGQAIRHTLAVAAAAVATVAAAAGLVMLLGTPWSNLIDAVWTYVVSARTGERVSHAALLRRLNKWPIALALICLPAVLRLATPGQRNAAATSLPILWLTGWVSYFAQASGKAYHLAPVVLTYIAWVAVVVAMALDRRRSLPRRAVPALLAGAFAVGAVHQLVVQFRRLPEALAQRDLAVHLAGFRENQGLTLRESRELAREIARRDDSGCLLAVGDASSVNVLAGLPQPTRFYYFPMLRNAPPALAARWAEQWEADLAKSRCRFVLVADAALPPADRPLPEGDRVTAALKRLLEQYPTSRRIGESQWTLYERGSAAATP